MCYALHHRHSNSCFLLGCLRQSCWSDFVSRPNIVGENIARSCSSDRTYWLSIRTNISIITVVISKVTDIHIVDCLRKRLSIRVSPLSLSGYPRKVSSACGWCLNQPVAIRIKRKAALLNRYFYSWATVTTCYICDYTLHSAIWCQNLYAVSALNFILN